jgi:hypothetical protein
VSVKSFSDPSVGYWLTEGFLFSEGMRSAVSNPQTGSQDFEVERSGWIPAQ